MIEDILVLGDKPEEGAAEWTNGDDVDEAEGGILTIMEKGGSQANDPAIVVRYDMRLLVAGGKAPAVMEECCEGAGLCCYGSR